MTPEEITNMKKAIKNSQTGRAKTVEGVEVFDVDVARAADTLRRSNKLIKFWADPASREKMSTAQSAGTKAAWSDPEKAKLRKQRRESTARELGFSSYGQLVAHGKMTKDAEKCGFEFNAWLALQPEERTAAKVKAGVIKPLKHAPRVRK